MVGGSDQVRDEGDQEVEGCLVWCAFKGRIQYEIQDGRSHSSELRGSSEQVS